ncbi:hypothetical protein BH11BAC4_BH11BAC4_17430 [soil metagenome]
MRQDTIYRPINDPAANAERVITQQIVTEQDLKKKSNPSSDYAPFYVIGMLALIWIIIRIRDWKNKGYVALW